jgi:hypothetical protein
VITACFEQVEHFPFACVHGLLAFA